MSLSSFEEIISRKSFSLEKVAKYTSEEFLNSYIYISYLESNKI